MNLPKGAGAIAVIAPTGQYTRLIPECGPPAPVVKILLGSELYIEGEPQFPGRIRGVGAAEEGRAERADEIHEVRVVESVEYINANFNELR